MTDRSQLVQAELAAAGLDVAIVAAPPNIAYLCGFHVNPHERLVALVVPSEGRPRLVCPSLEEEAARAAVDDTTSLHVWRDEEGPDGALAAALQGTGGRIGIEKRYLTVWNAELAQAAAQSAELAGCDDLLGRLRVRKSEDELDAIRRAAAIVDRVVTDLTALAAPGMTEAELADECTQRLRAAGGDAVAFPPLILTGARSALPHGHSDATALHEGDLLVVDIGVTVDGYSADITRTVVVAAEPNDRQREIFEVVHAANVAGIEAVRVGSPACAVDNAARRVIVDAGYGDAFVHRTGHGLGLEVHEPPYLTSANEEALEPGMVVTVEPGIYLEGFGGVRIEDDVVVREDGPEVLTQAPVSITTVPAGAVR
jgi:Xaa-Pro aminopeptidase